MHQADPISGAIENNIRGISIGTHVFGRKEYGKRK
jgi:hypothetical protein